MKKRVYGQEIELGSLMINTSITLPEIIEPDYKRRILPLLRRMAPDSFFTIFVENGGNSYLDGYHLEICTPEVSCPRDLVIYTKAMIDIVQEWYREEIIFFKDNTDITDAVSYGCHENYLYDPENLASFTYKIGDNSVWYQKNFLENLKSFIISALPLYGNGITVVKEGKFYISNRARFIIQEVSKDSTQPSRSIITSKSEPLGSPRYGRLHLSSRDPNLSQIQEFLKFGTMDLFLRAAEDGLFEDFQIFIARPLTAIRRINGDIFCQKKISLIDGKEVTALEIQEKFFELIDQNYPKPDDPPELKAMIKEIKEKWQFILKGLKRNPLKMWPYLDWPLKYKLTQRVLRKHNLRFKKIQQKPLRYYSILLKIKMLEFEYAKVKGGLYEKWLKKGLLERLVNKETIEKAKNNPPGYNNPFFRNRSYIRGRFIKWAKENKKFFNIDWDVIYWDDVQYKRLNGKHKEISLEDPLDWETEIF